MRNVQPKDTDVVFTQPPDECIMEWCKENGRVNEVENRLRTLWEALRLFQEALAKIIKITPTGFYRHEMGLAELPIKTVLGYAAKGTCR